MDKIILCFELNNNQRNYAMLMKVIQAIETDNNNINYSQILKEIIIRYYWLRNSNNINYSNRDIVRNIEQSWNIKENKTNDDWVAHTITDLKQVVEQKEAYDISYYVRVKNRTEEDITNIQYFLLILQQFPCILKRIKVFLEPFDQYYYIHDNLARSNVYFEWSHYLRLILPIYKHIFYSAYFENNGYANITQLTEKKRGIQSTFFPLLEVDSKMHANLASYFSLDIQGNWTDTEIQGELRDILEISRKILDKRIEKNLSKGKGKRYRETLYHALAEEGITSLQYAVFCVLVPISEELNQDDIGVYRERAISIGNGLIQIVENIVSHSIHHKGVFTFRIIQDGSNYLSEALKTIPTRQTGDILVIDIADVNLRETILDNFRNKLRDQDINLKKTQLSIGHFFGEFREDEIEAKNAWDEYRKNNPTKCMGLARLGIELRLTNAILQARSNTTYSKEEQFLSYNINHYNNAQFHDKKSGEFIPGTQFLIILSIGKQEAKKQHNANIFLNGIGNLQESDKAYARFIDFDFENFDVVNENKNQANRMTLLDQIFYNQCKTIPESDAKDCMVELWKNEFDRWESSKANTADIIYYFDMQEGNILRSPWGEEVFCKGLVNSAIMNSCKMKYVAITNCSDSFMQMLIDTMVLARKFPGEKNQFYLHGQDKIRDIVLVGANYESVIWNAMQYCYAKGQPPLFLQEYYESIQAEKKGEEVIVDLLPFDVVLAVKKEGITLFEEYIEKVAGKDLTATDEAGYLIENAHMRLGNKVHVKEFYEVSILFRKPRIARKLALLLVRRMKHDEINLKGNLLFYGYASYSKAILMSIVEILRQYHENHKKKYLVEFVVYQNDIMVQKTLTHISPKVRMYYSNKVPANQNMNIVQIVPISSTLTTFKKMWDMFLDDQKRKYNKYKLIKNYTLFWVRDQEEGGLWNKPTEGEKEYWEEIEKNRSIQTNIITPKPQYFCVKHTTWLNPLKCEQCYPENILDEIALVETDVTSTVPSQQLEVKKAYISQENTDRKIIINETRLIGLKDCVYYGHINRDGNHFQYYIETTRYFHYQKEYIQKWLDELRGQNKNKSNDRVLNIIVTPQHPTNVEFGHYVNDYYFDGVADMVTIDSSKEYRSNIIVKYADVKSAIAAAYNQNILVKFIYVDDTIITGSTFRRVNTLLHSLVPCKECEPIQFSKIFLLVNRLSYYSRMDYVRNVEEDFHAFVNIDISSIRNYGDSCTMCTLQKNSALFFKRSATTEISRYWNKKKYDYRTIPFDKYTQDTMGIKLSEKGYFRMLSSHYAKSRININENLQDDIFDIISLFTDLEKYSQKMISGDIVRNPQAQSSIDFFESEKISPIYCCVFNGNTQTAIKAFLKVLCRPFFSYGKNYRQAILDIFLILAESFLCPHFDDKLNNQSQIISTNKPYLNDSSVRNAMYNLIKFLKGMFSSEEKIDFIQKYLMEGLTDLRSNYIIRLSTMNYFKEQVKGYENCKSEYKKYERMVHRLINGSADETKSLWLEYLLITGQENKSDMNNLQELPKRLEGEDIEFNLFWDSLLIENTRLYYDSMLNFVKRAIASHNSDEEESISKAVEEMWGDYYIRNLRRFIQLEIMVDHETEDIEKIIKTRIVKTARLLYYLKNEKSHGIKRYNRMKHDIEDLLYYGDQLQILTSPFEGAKNEEELYAVTDYDKGKIDQNVIQRVKTATNDANLRNKSFFIGKDYIVLCIDNNEEYLKSQNILDKNMIRIQPLYFYIECNTDDHFRVIMRVRKILMYRYQILRWVESDFNNNAMPILAEQMSINRQLIRDKAGDHNNSTDILTMEKLLQSVYEEDDQDVYRWILLKVYVNMRIARLFRSEWSGSSETIRDRIYTKKSNDDSTNKALINIGGSFFGDTLDKYSPKRYFEFVSDCFQFDVDISGVYQENLDLTKLKKVLNKLYGRCEEGYYYKQEYIISIIFDILFNAIKNCRNWEVDLDRFFRDENNADLRRKSITENDIVAQCFILKRENAKCRIKISTELIPEKRIAYLVFRNVVAMKTAELVEKDNTELKMHIESRNTIGMSIQAIKWYTETIGVNTDIKAVFQYEWNEKEKLVEFVTKLPILDVKETKL